MLGQLAYSAAVRLRGERTGEAGCRFVSSRGILKSCRVHALKPRSSSNKIPVWFARAFKHGVSEIYLCSDMIVPFVSTLLPQARCPFTLVTGDSDLYIAADSLPRDTLTALLDHPLLKAWYAQNLGFQHSKLHHLPIGLDYHTLSNLVKRKRSHAWGSAQHPQDQERLMRDLAQAAGGLQAKKVRAFANWHFAIERGNRKECVEQAASDAVFYQETFLPREESWRLNSSYAFTLSPFGAGLDCHRTWEALLLGSIPIVMRSSLDALYQDLPVVIVDGWHEVNPARLEFELARITSGTFDFSRLELAYWMARIQGKTAPRPLQMSFDDFIQSN